MKTMTCKQLAGACDKEFQAETYDEMVDLSKKHGMEMAEQGDAAHIKVMEEMKEGMNDPEAVKEWVGKIQKEFDALPEDN